MQKAFRTYSTAQLPAGFKYPEKYLELAKSVDLPNDFVWWFYDASTEGGELSWRLRHSYGGRFRGSKFNSICSVK
ncbi:hypothetical protein D3C76_1188330 [compost metagenome]